MKIVHLLNTRPQRSHQKSTYLLNFGELKAELAAIREGIEKQSSTNPTFSATLWSKGGYLLGGAGTVKDKGEVPVVTIVSIVVVVLVTLDTNA